MSSHGITAALIHRLYRLQDKETHVYRSSFSDDTIFEAESPAPLLSDNIVRSALIVLFAASIGLFLFVRISPSHLHDFQGPRWAAFSNWWYLQKLLGGRQHIEFSKVSQEYGLSIDITLVN